MFIPSRKAAKALGLHPNTLRKYYTSKTNSWTGEIKNIGGREWIIVDGVKTNRDINGARGIFLRALVDSPTLQACIVNES